MPLGVVLPNAFWKILRWIYSFYNLLLVSEEEEESVVKQRGCAPVHMWQIQHGAE